MRQALAPGSVSDRTRAAARVARTSSLWLSLVRRRWSDTSRSRSRRSCSTLSCPSPAFEEARLDRYSQP